MDAYFKVEFHFVKVGWNSSELSYIVTSKYSVLDPYILKI